MMETMNSPGVFEPGFRSTDVSRLKNSMKLDFGSSASSTKSKKAQQASLLASPDLAMLKMASPELEKMIMAQQGFNGVSTSTGMTPTPTQFLFPKNVTEEQEQYARGFIQALEQLHKSGQPVTAVRSTTGATPTSSTATTLVAAVETVGEIGPSDASSYSLTTLSSTAGSGHSSTTVFQSPPHVLPTSAAQRPVDLTHNAAASHSLVAAPTATLLASLPGAPHSSFNGASFVTSSQAGPTSRHPVLLGGSDAVLIQNNNKLAPSTTSSAMIPHAVFSHDRVATLKTDPDGPGSASNSPPVSPINMETQELIKLERKRARNRLAATKCRKRKLDRIAHLEGRVAELKGTNGELSRAAQELRAQVSDLKKQILNHCKSGCSVPFLGEVEGIGL